MPFKSTSFYDLELKNIERITNRPSIWRLGFWRILDGLLGRQSSPLKPSRFWMNQDFEFFPVFTILPLIVSFFIAMLALSFSHPEFNHDPGAQHMGLLFWNFVVVYSIYLLGFWLIRIGQNSIVLDTNNIDAMAKISQRHPALLPLMSKWVGETGQMRGRMGRFFTWADEKLNEARQKDQELTSLLSQNHLPKPNPSTYRELQALLFNLDSTMSQKEYIAKNKKEEDAFQSALANNPISEQFRADRAEQEKASLKKALPESSKTSTKARL